MTWFILMSMGTFKLFRIDTFVVESVTLKIPSDSCICGARPQEMNTLALGMIVFGNLLSNNFTLISLFEYVGIVTFSVEQINIPEALNS